MNVTYNTIYLSGTSVKKNYAQEVKKHYNKFEKIWSYAGKSLLATRHTINSILRSCRWIALTCESKQSLKHLVVRLKIFSIVSVPLSLASLPALFQKVMNNVHWKDGKGTVLSSLSVAILLTDAFDSITTFASAAIQLANKPAIGWMSNLGMPLAFSIVSVGSIVRLTKLKDISGLLSKVDKNLIADLTAKKHTPDELKVLLNRFVDEKLPYRKMKDETTLSVLQDAKKHNEAVLERQSNSKVVKLVTALAAELDSDEEWSEEKTQQIMKQLKEIAGVLKKERGVQTGYLISNLMSAGALSLFSLPGTPAVPFVLLAMSTLLRISMQAYA